jgi:ATP-binding cassette, subfamily C, bacteriocin exporter
LQKLYPLTGGAIYLGSTNIKHLNNSLREKMGIVPQNLDLFAGTVIENIAPEEFNPDMRRILKVCEEMGMLDFIGMLPHGFRTYIGEHGTTLPGGQKQNT